jgi:hypothetical protein
LPAVARVPPFHGPLYGTVHLALPATGSHATSAPVVAAAALARACALAGSAVLPVSSPT